MTAFINKLKNLSQYELRQWAGSTILNRGKEYIDCVDKIFLAEDGSLAAWVEGSDDYATSVYFNEQERYEYFCSCPYDYGGPCKHVVALLLAGSVAIKNNLELPILKTNDPLYQILFEGDDLAFDDIEDPSEHVPQHNSNEIWNILNNKSKPELVKILSEIANQNPHVKQAILEESFLTEGKVDRLIKSIRKDFEPGEDPYDDYGPGSPPDYEGVRDKLKNLLEKGYADAVIKLGSEILQKSNEQMPLFDHDGDFWTEAADCMEIVLESLSQSSLSGSEQMCWIVDSYYEDEYDVIEHADAYLEKPTYTKEDWIEFSRYLENLLTPGKPSKDRRFQSDYRRKSLLYFLINSYEKSGQNQKIIPLLQKELKLSNTYKELVNRLSAQGKTQEAGQLAKEGYEYYLKQPTAGLANELKDFLRNMAAEQNRKDMLAAYRYEEFLQAPSLRSYQELKTAAENFNCWNEIREASLNYVETGDRQERQKDGSLKKGWPMPEPDIPIFLPDEKPRFRKQFPAIHLLIDIAIFEKRTDDVLILYRSTDSNTIYGEDSLARIAKAVQKDYPDEALRIWFNLASRKIALVKPAAYQIAADYLLEVHAIYKAEKRLHEWRKVIQELRKNHKNKRRLMSELDNLPQ